MKKENIENMLNNFKIVIRNDLDYLLRTQNCKDLLSYITDLQQENQKYKEVIDRATDILSKMMYAGYLKKLNESTIQYMDTGEKGEFGTRAKIILDILKEVE